MISRATFLGLAMTALVGSTSALAQADSVFARLAGSWSGNGTIAMRDGHSERIRCKAQYEVTPSGIIMHQSLRCASDSYKFDIASGLQATGNQIQGTWSETTRQVSGDVTGTIQGGDISTTVNGSGFSATLRVQTRGGSQAVSIVPQGTDIQAVTISMKRT